MSWIRAGITSLVATALAMGLMFWARSAFQVRTLPERLMEWLLLFVPLDAFAQGIQDFGPQAKVFALYGGIGIMSAALFGLGLLALRRRWPSPGILGLALALFVVAMAGIMPLTGAGLFATSLFQHPILVNGVYLGMALAYATVLLLGQIVEGALVAPPQSAGDGLTRRYALITSAVGMVGAYALAIRQSATGGGTVTSDLPLAQLPAELTQPPTPPPPPPAPTPHAASRHGGGTGHPATCNPGASGSDPGTGGRGSHHGAGRSSYPGAGRNGCADGCVTGRRPDDEHPHRDGRRGRRGANPSAGAAAVASNGRRSHDTAPTDGRGRQRGRGNRATGRTDRRAANSRPTHRRTTDARAANSGAADCRPANPRPSDAYFATAGTGCRRPVPHPARGAEARPRQGRGADRSNAGQGRATVAGVTYRGALRRLRRTQQPTRCSTPTNGG